MKKYITVFVALFTITVVSIGLIGCSRAAITQTTNTSSLKTTTTISTTSTTTSPIPTTSVSSTTKSSNTWTLHLVGVISQNIDQSIFKAGAALNCHGVNWINSQGHIWTGIPLWYLAGYVDDNTTMGFNDILADKGYEVDLVSSSGGIVKFTSAEIKRNDNMIVAYQLDGQFLPSTQWPLALVGSAVDQQHQISMITSIELILPSATISKAPLTTAQ